MNLSPMGLEFIKDHEGFRHETYRDSAGHATIGYGHKIREHEHFTTITEAEGAAILRHDVATAEAAVNRLVKVPLNQNQYDALVSFTYNLGEGNLAKSTLLRDLNLTMYYAAAQEFPKWCFAGGKPSEGLKYRRKAEMELFLTPVEGEQNNVNF